MSKEVEKFLQAEETAMKIVETLKQLHTEAISYRTATMELDVVRQQLLKLIETAEKVAVNASEVIKTLKEIGTPEILDRINEVKIGLADEFAEQSGKITALEAKVTSGFAEQGNRITALEDKVTSGFTEQENRITAVGTKVANGFAEQRKAIDKLRILIIITLMSSISAVIIGIVALLR